MNETGCPSFPLVLKPFAFPAIAGGTITFFGNALIILVVFRTTELRSWKCFLLLANLAAADLISSFAILSVGFIILLGYTCQYPEIALSNWGCFLTHIPFIISFISGNCSMLLVAMDRFLSVACPMFYFHTDTGPYVRRMVAISWVTPLPFLALAYANADESLMVGLCMLPTAFNGAALHAWNLASLFISIAVLLLYVCVYVRMIKVKADRAENGFVHSERDREIMDQTMRSVQVVVVVFLTTWVLTLASILLATVSGASPMVQFHVFVYVGILANSHVGSNFFILCCRAKEFRKGLFQILHLPETMTSRARVVPING